MQNRKAPFWRITKRDLLLLGGFLLIAGLGAAYVFSQSHGDRIRIYVGSALYQEADLSEDQVILIQQEDGKENRLVIANGQAYMESANCPNQDCIAQTPLRGGDSQLRALGNWIICLPNQVSVELVAEGE